MDNEYLRVVEEDVGLYAAIRESLPALQRMDSIQIEKLIFYLKSLHTYYPKSENLLEYCAQFDLKLEKLRNSPDQIKMKRKTCSMMIKGIASCMLSGMLLVGALIAALDSRTGIGFGIVVVSGVIVAYGHDRWINKALELFAEQDRWFFLSAIRTARACNELVWAGLFSYKLASGSESPEDDDDVRAHAQIGRFTAELRAALYNDQYFWYSSPELSVVERVDA